MKWRPLSYTLTAPLFAPSQMRPFESWNIPLMSWPLSVGAAWLRVLNCIALYVAFCSPVYLPQNHTLSCLSTNMSITVFSAVQA